MTKQELIRLLEPFDDDTDVVVRLRTSGEEFFELPFKESEYVPMKIDGDAPAYIALTCYQGDFT